MNGKIIKFKLGKDTEILEGEVLSTVNEIASRDFKVSSFNAEVGIPTSKTETAYGSVSKYLVKYTDELGVVKIQTIYPTNIADVLGSTSDIIKDKISYLSNELIELQEESLKQEIKLSELDAVNKDIDSIQIEIKTLTELLKEI